GQQLTMTPQLQQAIRLLQLSTLDLQQEIQQALETNPMLELDEEEPPEDGNEIDEPEAEPDDGPDETSADADVDDGDEDIDEDYAAGDLDGFGDEEITDAVSASDEDQIPEELPVDTSWDDIYDPTPAAAAQPDDQDWNLEDRNETDESLIEHLLWQLNLTPMSETDRAIAIAIIDAIDSDGMLTVSLEDILASVNGSTDDEAPDLAGDDEAVELAEVEAVLKRIQQFDPTGIAARSLSECLAIQLRALDADTPWRDEAVALVSEHLDVLAARDFNTLKRRTRLEEDDLAQVIALIQSMNPRPGSSISSDAPEYIVPDVIVFREKDHWKVELNPEATPRLKINELYAGFVKRADNSKDNAYLKEILQEARWFLKSLQSRHETLLKVATKIVEHQRGFLEYGDEAMKPLVLADIAEAVDMHESTISRVTSRKYMHTPRGIFELKYFFSSHVSTASGGEVSSTAIRALIRKLTADENPRKPLSDNKIAAILAEQSIKVARRTVAKYRESMAIPPSNERKRLV
ncbi:MAG: RNA polymerase factor sigma-54, partial [Gammaproteobacteria bacterium]